MNVLLITKNKKKKVQDFLVQNVQDVKSYKLFDYRLK